MSDSMDDDLREVRYDVLIGTAFIEILLIPTLYQRLKASLWFSIGKIVDEETQRLNSSATPQFIGTMTEMVWNQIGRYFPFQAFKFASYLIPHVSTPEPMALSRGLLLTLNAESVARDLESFARHAGRSTVTADDVLLITRRNDVLHGIMKDFVEKEQVAVAKEKGTKVSKGKTVKGKGKK
jgi:centromere protein S